MDLSGSRDTGVICVGSLNSLCVCVWLSTASMGLWCAVEEVVSCKVSGSRKDSHATRELFECGEGRCAWKGAA